MHKQERDPQVAIDYKNYSYVVQEAKKNKRTIKGQTEYMLDLAKKIIEKNGRTHANNL
jgi:hypothetical protein